MHNKYVLVCTESFKYCIIKSLEIDKQAVIENVFKLIKKKVIKYLINLITLKSLVVICWYDW